MSGYIIYSYEEYRGFFICSYLDRSFFRVKKDPDCQCALHHGSFTTHEQAQRYIDSLIEGLK